MLATTVPVTFSSGEVTRTGSAEADCSRAAIFESARMRTSDGPTTSTAGGGPFGASASWSLPPSGVVSNRYRTYPVPASAATNWPDDQIAPAQVPGGSAGWGG